MQFTVFVQSFLWMKSCISKHEISVMLELFSDTSIVLEQICTFKISIIAKLNIFVYECSDKILLREISQRIVAYQTITHKFFSGISGYYWTDGEN